VTITLTVRTASWRAHVARVASTVEGLVPVVKGNGYGFGRVALAGIASEFCDTVAVGTVHELDGLPDGLDAVVLTPTLAAPASTDPVLTVGHPAHLECLDGWNGRVLVKLESSMHRYGASIELIDVARARGLDVIGVSIHLPLAGTSADHADEVCATIADVDAGLPVWLSHLDPPTYASLPSTHTYRLRLGTSLWHGDKSTLQLRADVLDVRPIRSGQHAGYRQGQVDGDGHLVMIGAGTSSGVTELPDGRSPFHFERRRLRLHEPPHMHTSMAFVRDGDPVPGIGASIDVQRPLTMTTVDAVDWI
jgi:alanine racemase